MSLEAYNVWAKKPRAGRPRRCNVALSPKGLGRVALTG